ncbi:uncharacterized protein LOC129594223 isoform X2 [Paramacrobiotus metropolitanus]|uniref:uncharacterized protein LOC129594223 isoform X2 n=1 Tax=Paramacrobiotus metropolitanus TaxID=2943436 RepID=UPI0024460B3E|nr:uncharacterized protein LOC129594223 isoform X2 [Paramacrobiotus metropolitanus]
MYMDSLHASARTKSPEATAKRLARMHEEILDKMDKILFIQSTNKGMITEGHSSEDSIQKENTVKLIHILTKSARPHGFSIRTFVDINQKTVLLLIVCISGYATFVVDRTEDEQENRSYATDAIRLNLSNCHPKASMHRNISSFLQNIILRVDRDVHTSSF